MCAILVKKIANLLTHRLSDDVDERTAAIVAAATDLDEVFGFGDAVDGGEDGEPDL